jgi:DNA-binding MurR/RpiR family transcriptional regulator
MDRDEMSNIYRGHSINASYQVSVHLVYGFQRRRLKCEKLTDDGCQVMAKAECKGEWVIVVHQNNGNYPCSVGIL